MSEWKTYKRKGHIEATPYVTGTNLVKAVSISEADLKNGSPKEGDMIARNPNNHDDKWLISADFFKQHYEE